ncbi:hypothetical protein [Sulfitobacter sp.]|uniref:hypothetical protein n=1 Tax=Sulfitobacter sp. TaxID=1903071 RepID=UPI00356AA4E5
MKQIIIVISICLFGSFLSAEPMFVASGDHDGFTRIVIHSVSDSSWVATHADGQIEIKVIGANNSFDISDVYRRISRVRIRSISVSGNAVRIDTSCDCSASLFSAAKGMIVVDIASPGTALQTPILIGNLTRLTGTGSRNLSQRELQISKPDSNPFKTREFLKDVAAFRFNISHSLSELITTDILERETDIDGDDEKYTKSPKQLFRQKLELGSFNNAAVSASIQNVDDKEVPDAVFDCNAAKSIRILNAGMISGDFTEVSKSSRTGLLRSETVDILWLLHNGFGAEAIQLTEILNENTDDISFLTMVGELLEYGHARPTQQLAKLFDCFTDLKIWKLAAEQPREEYPVESEVKASLLSASQFPPHLRKLLFPLLETRLGGREAMLKNQAAPDSPGYKSANPDGSAGGKSAVQEKSTSDPEPGRNHGISEYSKMYPPFRDSDITPRRDLVKFDASFNVRETDPPNLSDGNSPQEIAAAFDSLIEDEDLNAAFDVLRSGVASNQKNFVNMTNKFFRKVTESSNDLQFIEFTTSIGAALNRVLDAQLIKEISSRQGKLFSPLRDGEIKYGVSANGISIPASRPSKYQVTESAAKSKINAGNTGQKPPTPKEVLDAGADFKSSLDHLLGN